MSTLEQQPLVSSEGIQYISIPSLFRIYSCTKEGYTSEDVQNYREKNRSMNILRSPGSLPKWLCCLLACFGIRDDARKFRELIPNCANVLRDGKFVFLDPTCVIVGDIISLKRDELVPADVRVIEVNSVDQPCIFNTTMVSGSDSSLEANPFVCCNVLTDSPNVALAGYKCSSGECLGIVVAIGQDCYLSQLVEKGAWPPGKSSKGEKRPENREETSKLTYSAV